MQEVAKQVQALTAVAKENLGKFVFVIFDFGDESIAQIKTYFQVKDDQLPITVLYEVNMSFLILIYSLI